MHLTNPQVVVIPVPLLDPMTISEELLPLEPALELLVAGTRVTCYPLLLPGVLESRPHGT